MSVHSFLKYFEELHIGKSYYDFTNNSKDEEKGYNPVSSFECDGNINFVEFSLKNPAKYLALSLSYDDERFHQEDEDYKYVATRMCLIRDGGEKYTLMKSY